MQRIVLLVLVTLGAATAAGAKDLIIRERITGGVHSKPQPREVTQYVYGKKRISDGPAVRTIVDLKAKTLTMIDKNRKTYSTLTFEELRQQTEALNARVRGLPDNIRDMVGHVTNMDEGVTLKPTKNTEKIAGYTAKEYTIEAQTMKGSVWITTAFDVSAEGREWEDFGGALSTTQGRHNKLGAAVAKVKGFPLRTTVTTEVGRDDITTQTETLEIKEGAPPPEVLTVPEGYTKLAPRPAK